MWTKSGTPCAWLGEKQLENGQNAAEFGLARQNFHHISSVAYCTTQHTLNDFYVVFVISELFKAQMTRRAIRYNMCVNWVPIKIFDEVMDI
jgi:hypothetical protein